MKKFFLFALTLSAVLIGSATLPERTIDSSRQIKKTLSHDTERIERQRSRQRAAEAQSETALSVPFLHTLGKNTEVNDYLVIDANSDTRTWKPGGYTAYSVCMAPNTDNIETADDWLISPAVHLEAGKYYTVSYEEDMTLNKIEDKLGLYAGTERSAEGMTMPVIPEHAYGYTNKVFTKKEAQFTVPETGSYYFGFHCTSERTKSGTPKICNFAIDICEVPIIVPEKFVEVPFKHTLGKNTEVADYIVIDADNDTRTWKPGGFTGYSVCMKPLEGESNNDWLISIPVHLMPGVNYSLSYEEGFTLSSGKEDLIGIYMGTEPTVESLTTAVVPVHAVTVRDFTEKKTDFSVPAEGYYYFGFHCTSETAKSGNLKLCNFAIKESTEEIVPPAAGKLEVIPAPLGELKATVKYTAPTLNIKGENLSTITKVVVTTNWAFPTEFTEVVPGAEYTFETTDVYANAYNRFEAIAYVGDVAGESTLIKDMLIGPDNPLPPTNVKAVLSDDFKTVTLTWDPVGSVGEKGGYVDTSKITYYVFDAFGSYYDPALVETTETTVTFDYSDVEEQDFMAYQVTAGVDQQYYSLDASSNIVVIGQPEKLPFHESFANARYSHVWVVDPESNGQVMQGTIYDNELQTNTDADEGVAPEYLNSHDADNGFYLFMPVDINSTYGFYSAKISIKDAAKPVFEFWYQGKGSVLEAKLGVDGGDMEVIHSIDLKENSTDDWTLARIDLSPYKSANYIQIGVMLRAIHNTDENIWSVPFDNMRVIDLKDEAIRISTSSIPDEVAAGKDIPLSFTIENIGLNQLKEANLSVNVDGEDLEPVALGDLAPGKIATAEAVIPTSLLSEDKVEIVASAKINNADEGIKTDKTVNIKFPIFPMPTELQGKASAENKHVALSWAAPDFEELTKAKAVNEDFENPEYEAFTYSDFAGFTFVDMDGGDNYTFLDDINNPYRSYPMAYQLFSPQLAGVPESKLPDCPTHSGNSMLVAWSTDGQNANLLISPELTGARQTITFWARGFTIAGGLNETFSFWVSDTDTNVKSFTQIKDFDNYNASLLVPEEWTEFHITVPEGTKYFGILHDAYDSYALFLDDISFEAAGILPIDTELIGYNVHVDGKHHAAVQEAAHIHTPEADGTYEYRLTAVYNHGESRATAPVSVEFDSTQSGIAEIADDLTIECHNHILTVIAAEGTPITVIDLSGRIIATAESTLTTPVNANGIIFVTAGTHTVKVTVK
ncbi:MAG: choice-of-anchor J domain-containing protein [Muribaculaceae bacterium]|nr:choice-of-anchor J domain-containing protein [Muribaculaceae bacterium]